MPSLLLELLLIIIIIINIINYYYCADDHLRAYLVNKNVLRCQSIFMGFEILCVIV